VVWRGGSPTADVVLGPEGSEYHSLAHYEVSESTIRCNEQDSLFRDCQIGAGTIGNTGDTRLIFRSGPVNATCMRLDAYGIEVIKIDEGANFVPIFDPNTKYEWRVSAEARF